MHFEVRNLLKMVLLALALVGSTAPTRTRAQTYPIDCAILLCLSGGWPASVPCALARAEFIRRITPWPVEPPLQIWRCPMGASFEGPPMSRATERVIEALFRGAETLQQTFHPQSLTLPLSVMTGSISKARTPLGATW
jgi:hypothetical protein